MIWNGGRVVNKKYFVREGGPVPTLEVIQRHRVAARDVLVVEAGAEPNYPVELKELTAEDAPEERGTGSGGTDEANEAALAGLRGDEGGGRADDVPPQSDDGEEVDERPKRK